MRALTVCLVPTQRTGVILVLQDVFVEEPEFLQQAVGFLTPMHEDHQLKPELCSRRDSDGGGGEDAGTVDRMSRLMTPHRHQDGVKVRLSGESTASSPHGQKIVWRGS